MRLKQLLAGVSVMAATAFAGPALADPAMWKATDADSEVYFLGSFHALDADATWQTDLLKEVMADADFYYYEAKTDGAAVQAQMQTLIQQHGLNPPDKPLNSYFSEEEKAIFEEGVAQFGVAPAQMQPLRPWLANLQVALLIAQKAGYNPQTGVESVLLPMTDDSKERFFETAEEQIKFFAGMSDEVQTDMLIVGLQQYADNPDMINELAAAWKSGDVDELNRIGNESLAGLDPQIYEIIIKRRNVAWVEEIVTLMEGEEDGLITVGALHMVGEDGVPALLRGKGITVERVQ